MDSGELLTRWTVRVALAFYVIALAVRLLARGQPAWLAVARLAWTAGYVMFLLHVAFAFEFYHHWSHDAAYQDTARQTEEVIGVAWGGGVYANYVFVVVWGFDALWWWALPPNVSGTTTVD
jgi:hypothetical protein